MRCSELAPLSRWLLPAAAFPPPCSQRASSAVAELGVVRPLHHTIMNFRTALLTFLTGAIFSGCATSPVSISDSRQVQSDRSSSYSPMAASGLSDGGRLVVVRDSGFFGSATKLRLSIDGTVVADLKTSERYDSFISEGDYVLGVIPVPNVFSNHTAAETSVVVKKGQTYRFRAGFGYGGLILQRSTLSTR